MDEKLEKYRAKVRRKELYEKIKLRLIKMVTFSSETNQKKDETIEIPNEKLEEIESADSENGEARSFVSSEEEEEEDSLRENETRSNDNSKLKHVLYVVWFLFWATCWMIAIELQFGIVFLLFSALLGIYFNTRTGPKRKGEISAYSVFNENCESIQGTLDAKQLEGEMLYGPLYRNVH